MKCMQLVVVLLALSGGLRADSYTGRDFLNDLFSPGDRRGLSLRIDATGGFTYVKAEHDSWTPNEFTKTQGGVGSVVAIGVGVSEHVIISGNIRFLSFGDNAEWAWIIGPLSALVTDQHTFAGLGVTYYYSKHAPSWFFEGGFGGTSINSPFDNSTFDSDDFNGPGFYLGAGYEFTRYLQVGAHWVWSRTSDSDYDRYGRWTASTVVMSLGFIIY